MLNDAHLLRLRELRDENDPLDFLTELIDTFIQSVEQLLPELRLAIDSASPEIVEKIAHRLKGSGSELGAITVAECCFDLEKSARQKNLLNVANQYESIVAACESAIKELNTHWRI